MVYLFLYLLVLILGLSIQSLKINFLTILIETFLNIIIVVVIISVGWLYSNFILKKKFLGESIGGGDLFLFIALCFCFPTISFIVFFVISLLYSLLIHFIIKKRDTTVPLAGYMSLFFMLIYMLSFSNSIDLYNFYFVK